MIPDRTNTILALLLVLATIAVAFLVVRRREIMSWSWTTLTVARHGLAQNWFRFALLLLLAAAVMIISAHLRFMERRAARLDMQAEQHYVDEQERERQAYVAKRHNDCYDIFARERAKFSNAQSVEYDDEANDCVVFYKRSDPKASNYACAELRKTFWSQHTRARLELECADNTFDNAF